MAFLMKMQNGGWKQVCKRATQVISTKYMFFSNNPKKKG